MTKVQIQFDLERPLDDAMLDRMARVHGVYGMMRVAPESDLRGLVVDYDASRLTPADVEAVLRGAGVPVIPRVVGSSL